MTEKRFTYGLREGTTQYEIKDNQHEYPIVEPFYYESYAKKVCDFLNELNDENTRLKQTMQEVAELLSEEVDLFSDKATEHDICAYVELKELDNKDAYYMATATKKAIKILKELIENDYC